MDDAAPLPAPDVVLDRLERHLRGWLGAWPPTGAVTVVGSPRRLQPGWDGAVRPFVGLATPAGAVLSVPPGRVDALTAAVADARGGGPDDFLADVLDRVPAALGAPGAVVGRGVFRYSTGPRPGVEPVGHWVSADDPRVPGWLRPFGGQVLVVLDDDRYVAGLGIKRHDELGREVAVATEDAWRGRGLARGLVVRATARILRSGGVPTYLHGRGNAASARVAEAAGFDDLGWSILGLPVAT
jgi:GNAT superfamily N-acetyltransferase